MKSLSPSIPKTEITSSCKTKEVAASPSANETILAIEEEEAVDEHREVDDEHILLFLALQDSAFSILDTLGLSFFPQQPVQRRQET